MSSSIVSFRALRMNESRQSVLIMSIFYYLHPIALRGGALGAVRDERAKNNDAESSGS